MTRRKQFSTRAIVKTICTTLCALTLSSTPAFAEYRAWFAPWDYVGDFQPGDISEDFSEMVPPDEACGLRISTPSYYAWTDDVDGIVASHDLYQDVIIWIDNPGADCTESFSVTKADKSATYSPPDGGGIDGDPHQLRRLLGEQERLLPVYVRRRRKVRRRRRLHDTAPGHLVDADGIGIRGCERFDHRSPAAGSHLQRRCRPGAAGGTAADAAAEPDRDSPSHAARRTGVIGAGSRRRCDPNAGDRAHGSRLVRVTRSEGLLRRVVCGVHQGRPRRRGERFAHARSLVPLPPALTANDSGDVNPRAIAAAPRGPYVSRGNGPSPAQWERGRASIGFSLSPTARPVHVMSP